MWDGSYLTIIRFLWPLPFQNGKIPSNVTSSFSCVILWTRSPHIIFFPHDLFMDCFLYSRGGVRSPDHRAHTSPS